MSNDIQPTKEFYAEIRKVIPKHCFERSLWRSSKYLLTDMLAIGISIFVMANFGQFALLWPIYWAVQGCLFTAVWVIAHECGHGAFCRNQRINNTVGFVLHTVLLVPYFSWRASHASHHRFTNHLEADEVFVPSIHPSWLTGIQETTVGRACIAVVMIFLGWPLYLLFNASGRQYDASANHFLPSSPVFRDSDRSAVIASNLGLLAWLGFLLGWCMMTSITHVIAFYGVPLIVANGWLVTITYLQHTDERIPHYGSERWTWLDGALATVDRDFGMLNRVFHHITDTHVLHHLFPQIPHHHAREATTHLATELGHRYRIDSTPFYVAFWRCLRDCVIVKETTDGVFHWQHSTKEYEQPNPKETESTRRSFGRLTSSQLASVPQVNLVNGRCDR